MKQVVQAIAGGPVQVLDVPRPTIGPTEVLVRTRCSIVSAGTEHAVTSLARASLLRKARARPDLVRQVINKAKTQGLAATAATVQSKMAGFLPLGYSACGVVEQVGEHVQGIAVGQLVATGGAGKANHADYQAVPALLCSPVPDGVDPTEAAFATVASIALHGLRLGDIGPGSNVVVVGLGLIGQLALRLAAASGAIVAGIDVADAPLTLARDQGALALREAGDATTAEIRRWSRGRGADCVIVAAGGASSAVMRRVPELCRDRATVVVIGDVGLDIERRPFYERELTLRFARSYGPGRYEHAYEDLAIDYEPGQVRFTEGRNLEAVLALLAAKRLVVADLVTHRYPISNAIAAYELVESRAEPFVALAFDYAEHRADCHVQLRPRRREPAGIGLIGAGAFASSTLLPAFKAAGAKRLVAVASASGVTARVVADRFGFERAVSGADAVIDDPDVDVVIVATAHDSHAELTRRALEAGKHVFCEKPIAIDLEELDTVEKAWRASGQVLYAGFNRRFSPAVAELRRLHGSAPKVITYRVNAGPIPDKHWYRDRRQGGRLLGEVCHFVDTCAAIVGREATSATAMAASAGNDGAVLALAYPEGSLAVVAYAPDGHPRTAKERIEVLGGGQSSVVDDFRSLEALATKPITYRDDRKGHQKLVAAFLGAVRASQPDPTSGVLLASMRTTLSAVAGDVA